jgi:hypothetical protein
MMVLEQEVSVRTCPPKPAGRLASLVLALGVFAVSSLLQASLPGAEPTEQPAKRWYKGNLHTHSLWSDGNDFPEMIVDWYVRHGYHFLALSDHNVLSRGERWIAEDMAAKRGAIGGLARYQERFGQEWVETREREGELEVRLKPLDEFRSLFERPGEFLLLEAEEITDNFQSRPIHVNASNVAEYIRPQGGESVRDTIGRNLRAVEEQSRRLRRPMLAHLNHPSFGYAVTAEDMAHVSEHRFFEVYNGHPSVNQLGDATHASLERMWDIANTLRISELQLPPLHGLATDDSHNYFGNRGASTGRGWVVVRAANLEPESLMRAIYAGDFYASSGVVLDDVRFDSETGVLKIEIAAEEGLEYTTEFVGTRRGFNPTSRPVLDAAGNELPVTRRYSEEVGSVLSRATGGAPQYKMRGDELYVRAIITSSREHPNPSIDGQREQAWVQPVTPTRVGRK